MVHRQAEAGYEDRNSRARPAAPKEARLNTSAMIQNMLLRRKIDLSGRASAVVVLSIRGAFKSKVFGKQVMYRDSLQNHCL